MALEHSISIEPVKEKLRNLKNYLPDELPILYKFGEFLADRLGDDQLLPEGFNMNAELTLYDLQTGIDGFTQQPIRSELVGQPPIFYASLRMRVPDIAKAVCPKDFAKGVIDFYEAINAKLKEM